MAWDEPVAGDIRVRVPGKLNCALRVGPRRPDGYHELATVFQAVSLYDEVSAIATDDDAITCVMPGADDFGDDNLAVKAARLLRERAGLAGRGVALTIDKRLPVAGGMAGGSADAAAALVACAAAWNLDVPTEEMHALAAELGSDVPFALTGGVAYGSGRGEILVPALARGTYHWVLAFARRGLSTPAVFRRFDALVPDPPPPQPPRELMSALAAGDPVRLGRFLTNDLAEPALTLAPELRRTLNAGRALGVLGSLLAGSGPTIAFLVATEREAIDVAVELSSLGVARDVRRVTGPVAGATLL
ncbi:MAG: 4-(cytidine 5'-diphospho)-2-C-methyl-D-erythritol kinase [Propionibacteriaceae bacterium]|jgi:4-diphosphocytidyl-2-C-methyl-D-erythritol kinase|nr:4-(cytidine 5'-diphospho)-2-C-methyl-D-erythritol kinase [Propionibacteriaceae bacterium]